MALIKNTLASLVNHLFQTLLITYLLLLLIEQVWPGFVSVYLNLNYLLIIVIVAGILDVFSEHQTQEEKITKKHYILIIFLGIAGTVIIYYKTSSLGGLSWLISIIAGVLIILLSILTLQPDEKGPDGEESAQKHKHLKPLGFALGGVVLYVLATLIPPIFFGVSLVQSTRIVFGSVIVLFLPGFILSLIFFPARSENSDGSDEAKSIDMIERIALSFALSIAIVPLAVFYLNLLGVKINFLNSIIIVCSIIVVEILVLYITSSRKKSGGFYPSSALPAELRSAPGLVSVPSRHRSILEK